LYVFIFIFLDFFVVEVQCSQKVEFSAVASR